MTERGFVGLTVLLVLAALMVGSVAVGWVEYIPADCHRANVDV
jgi:hypothetical protein